MHGRIFFWSLTSAPAGFLFGFDTVVISGAEKTIQTLWGLSPELHVVAMASALYGTVVGSGLGGWPADRFGRLVGVDAALDYPLFNLKAVVKGFAARSAVVGMLRAPKVCRSPGSELSRRCDALIS